MSENQKFYSLEWFQEKMETSVERVLDARINQKLDTLFGAGEEVPAPAEPLYIALRLVNETLTIVLRCGTVLTKPQATETDYERVKAAVFIEEIMHIISDREVTAEKEEIVTENERTSAIVEGYNMLTHLSDFTFDGDNIFLAGTSRTIPPLLVEKFTAVVGKYAYAEDVDMLEELVKADEEYQSLKNFFMWCCLNPRAEVADKLYTFLEQNGMKITKQGFFVALRNVVEVPTEKNNELVQFVSNAYNKVKAVWKKNANNYYVTIEDNGSYGLSTSSASNGINTILGKLTDMYKDLPNMVENRYTDNWTKTFDIRVGQVVSMSKDECNWSTQDCATAGLHFAGYTAPYVLCGDTSVFTLHNPMKVVGIGNEKGRCWEYLPFMTTTVKEADAIMNSRDFDFLQLDEDYAIRELEGLAEKAKDGFTVETNKYNFNLPSISSVEIHNIVKSLNDMKDIVNKRVSIIE